MFPQHRIALEQRGPGIWLLFTETLKSSRDGIYKQQLLHICKTDTAAEKDAEFENIVRHLEGDIIIRDNSHRNERFRKA